ncbi:hypothetical protein AYM40_00860 [Paraburkholderia phytofirmans OLGA172]|uniref:Uncharacterized protein n=2 Tax=Burkholderiaceae TaxID=119060 RepID=A0A160FGI9_9BURK|nr:hypothetical protein AYM40_00860 [Paraburkholderia phytofirmans OLGA172]
MSLAHQIAASAELQPMSTVSSSIGDRICLVYCPFDNPAKNPRGIRHMQAPSANLDNAVEPSCFKAFAQGHCLGKTSQ